MSKKCSEKTREKQRRGTFEYQHPEYYQPWIHVRECANGNGCRHLLWDEEAGRTLHLMSNLEKETYYLLKKQKVADILEQYPLELKRTLSIAEKLGIPHPRNPKTKEWTVMTSDFLVLIKVKEEIRRIALAVKPKSELKKVRVREKLLLERRYWEEQNVSWYLVTEMELH